MANDSESDGVRLKQVIVDLLNQLDVATCQCEQLINDIGTDVDHENFRVSLAAQIRDAVALCHCIKKKFHEMAGIQQYPMHESVQLPHLQQQFIITHGRLKHCVSTIKTKCKQIAPHKHNIAHAEPEEADAVDQDEHSMHVRGDMDDMDMDDDDDDMDGGSLVKEILMQGWLFKKSRYLKSWRRRWCVLDKNTEDLTLFTFKHEKQYTQPTETLLITDDVDIRLCSATHTDFVLVERTSNAHFRFRAENDGQRRAWSDMLHGKQEENKCKISQLQSQSQSHTALSDISDVSADALSVDSSPLYAGHASVDDAHVDDVDHCKQQEQGIVLRHNRELRDEHEYVSFNLYDECDTEDMDHEHEQEQDVEQHEHAPMVEEEEETQQSKNTKYDASTPDVRDCLELIDDLQLVRTEMSSRDLKILAEFEHSLKYNHGVTAEEINKLRDVSIKVIGFMLDHDADC